MPDSHISDLAAITQLIPLSCSIYSSDGSHVASNEQAQKRINVLMKEPFGITDFYPYIASVNDKPFKPQNLAFHRALTQKKLVKHSLLELKFSPKKRLKLRVDAMPFEYMQKSFVLLTFSEVTQAEREQRAQKQFIKLIGHELKQPLTLMKTYTYLIRSKIGSDHNEIEGLTRKIDEKIQNLASMLDDISSHARFSLASFKLDKQATILYEIVAEAAAETRLLYPEHNIKLNTPDDLKEAELELDKVKIAQVCTNLLSNACKYSSAGSTVHIKLSQVSHGIELAISDEGEGISLEEQANIFEPYYRTQRKRKKNVEGLGLGLAFVKKIVEKHQAKLAVESQLDKGTTFRILF